MPQILRESYRDVSWRHIARNEMEADAEFLGSSGEELEEYPETVPSEDQKHVQSKKSDEVESLRLKNRLAARKFREKRHEMMTKLEEANDSLRAKLYELTKTAIRFQVQNSVIERELQFFQTTMKSLMKFANVPN